MNMALDICIAKGGLLCDAEGKKNETSEIEFETFP
jgi:hypothetical protein